MSQLMPPENLGSRVLTVLSLPLLERLQELSILFDRCSLRQIQEIYPHIVHSVFGINGNPLGWGLRTTTLENNPLQFQMLHQFFGICGSWMHLCHRLLADQCKFELDVSLLPAKFVSMLQAGQNPMFYGDLINMDPLRNQLGTLSLNAFDFYIIHFVLYALQPLHSINPIAMQIHNVRSKTVYLKLVSEYLNNYLPLFPDARIEPVHFSSGVKAPQPLPAQALQPLRQPRYLKIPSSFLNGGNVSVGVSSSSNASAGNTSPQSSGASTGAARAYAWRSESVLHFFVDIWLRYDIESEHHLPSSDFVRGVRTLVKQIHFFANGASQDHSSLCCLRKVSLGMVKSRIYAFICGLIDRWPLDSSLMVVLELWLSYIQPWRYTMAALNNKSSGLAYLPPISSCFDGFIIDNLIMYTHIFIQLLPRFQRLDYTVYRNAFMLYRLATMFSQNDLIDRLQRYERLNAGNSYGFDSPQRQVNMMNKSLSPGVHWSPVVGTHFPKLFSETMKLQMENFLLLISMSRNSIHRDMAALRNQIAEKQRSNGFLINFFNKLFGESTQDEVTLHEFSRIPEVLRQCIDAFCRTFNVDQANLSLHENMPEETCAPASAVPLQKFSFFDDSDSLDTSKINPHQMSLNASNIQATIDPAQMPVRTNEVKPLVRLLYCLSEKINKKYGSQIQAYYTRDDYCGKVARQLLYAPMTEQWFDKRAGNTVLCERLVPPRVCLRQLGSLPVLATIGLTLLIGQVLWGSPILGLILLSSLVIGYNLLLALFS
ncbi:sphingomyelin phosphodiesterase 4 [Drosophila bipectinata]|uniref:sphingomyelin phosphodiesterase 4 n=1 Tax=Drosophila bipectinata TaxID=42026 RepID=UPI001C8A26B0|nr:sphingomyelin phosphodiesterase 4 [Drosophila bipectinata]